MQITLLGCGNMGAALIQGIARTGLATHIKLYNPTKEKATQLATKLPLAQVCERTEEAAHGADIIILAMKPYGILPNIQQLLPVIEAGQPLLISVAAGITLSTMESLAPTARLMRLMPNTPVLIGQGASGLVRGSKVSDEDVALCHQLMAQTGVCLELASEEHIHLIGALAGCAPAYFFELLDAMGSFGAEHGLSREDSLLLASQAMLGAASLLQKSDKSPKELRNAVTSPNGVTLNALRKLNSLHVKEAWAQTMNAAVERSREMEEENAQAQG